MKISRFAIALLAVTCLIAIAAACGDDDDDSADTPATTAAAPTTPEAAPTTTEAPAPTTAEPAPAPTTSAPPPTTTLPPLDCSSLDANGDNEVRIGVATAGPRDDGAYYQALVEFVEEFSAANECFKDPIVVDRIDASEAATELSNLAQQDVDIIAVGAGEIAEPLADLTVEYSDIFWYCNCGAGYQPLDTLAQSQDDASEILYTAGYATGLLLQESGGDSTAFLGCCDLGFEKEAYLAFEMGLQAVDPSFTMEYTPTGNFPFDFDNVSGATEAFEAAIQNGVDALNPYLGGAHRPLVQIANENDIIVMSAGASDACEDDELDYDIAVRFDAGDYLGTIFGEIQNGDFTEGTVRVFRVGVDPEPGAVICDATDEQQAAMDEVYDQIANGDFAADFGAIKGQAYSG